MDLLSSLLTLSLIFSYSICPATARGPHHSSLPSGFKNGTHHGGSARHLFEVNQSPPRSVDKAHGYMTNSDLEKAMEEFGQRCSQISRVYSIGNSVNGVPLVASGFFICIIFTQEYMEGTIHQIVADRYAAPS